MKTPTLEVVKAYFKDAKEVRCNEYDSIYEQKIYEIDINSIEKLNKNQIICKSIKKDTPYVSLYYRGKYAKIISYKEKTMKNYKKIDHFEPIAMKCTEEQFNELKPILEKFGLYPENIDNNWKEYCYLKNNGADNNCFITNIPERWKSDLNRKVYESFNAKTFLKACGIVEKSEKVEIRTELLKQLAENNSFSEDLIKKEFPQLFETPNDIITIIEKYGKDKVISLVEQYKN